MALNLKRKIVNVSSKNSSRMIYKVQNQNTVMKTPKSYVTFKIKTLDYYGTYDISIDSYSLNDIIDYNYTYILLGRLGRLNTLKGNL